MNAPAPRVERDLGPVGAGSGPTGELRPGAAEVGATPTSSTSAHAVPVPAERAEQPVPLRAVGREGGLMLPGLDLSDAPSCGPDGC